MRRHFWFGSKSSAGQHGLADGPSVAPQRSGSFVFPPQALIPQTGAGFKANWIRLSAILQNVTHAHASCRLLYAAEVVRGLTQHVLGHNARNWHYCVQGSIAFAAQQEFSLNHFFLSISLQLLQKKLRCSRTYL
jgi:hypothetical protein